MCRARAAHLPAQVSPCPAREIDRIAARKRSRRVSLTALLAIAPMLIFYGWSCQRDVQFWDVGEMQTVPWIFGIAHPTGFPLFTLLGFAFAHALPFGSVAWRLSFFSSLATCATGWFAYRLVAEETGCAWPALGVAFLFDATSVAWSRGTRADVHPLAAAFEAAAIYALLRWRRTAGRRAFVAAFALLGCALAVHPVAAFAIPGVAMLAVLRAPRPGAWGAFAAALAFAVPLVAYATIPLRGAVLFARRRDPTLALGLSPGAPFWDYGHTQVFRNFLWFVSGSEFHREAGAAGFTNAHAFLGSLAFAAELLVDQFGVVLVSLALVGIAAYAREKAVPAAALVLIGACVVPFAFAYAEEADKQRYLLMTLFVAACAIGVGASAVVQRFARFGSRAVPIANAVTAAALTALAAAHFYANVNVIAVNRDGVARRYVEDVRAFTPHDAIVVADWVYATPLAYAAYVERGLAERVVVTGTPAGMRPYVARWSVRRCVALVSESAAPPVAGARRRNAALPYIFTLPGCR